MEKGAKLSQTNMQGKTAFDIAKEFADPRVYFTVKNKIDSLPKPKDPKKKGEKPKGKSAAGDKKKKKTTQVLELKLFLERRLFFKIISKNKGNKSRHVFADHFNATQLLYNG